MTGPIPGASAQWLVGALADRGVDTARLLAQAGLDVAWCEDPDGTLNEAQYACLVRLALDASGDEALGLNITRQPNYLSRFGFWGYAIQSCANFQEALDTSIRYWPLSGSLVRLCHTVGAASVEIRIAPAFDFVRGGIHRFAVEKVISSISMLHEWILGRPLPVQRVSVSYDRPAHAASYDAHIGCPVTFASDDNRIVFDRVCLSWPLVSRQPLLAQACKLRLAEALRQLQGGDPFVAQVQERIQLGAQGFPDIQAVAEALHMSARTLRRHLQDRGTSYQRILDGVREATATDYLLNSNLRIEQIAYLLGFSEPTTFRSAFKRWTGRSASEVRRGRTFAVPSAGGTD